MKGTLIVVGTGLQLGQTTISAKNYIQNAEKLIYLVADPITESWLKELNSTAESLYGCYGEGKNRIDSYNEMVDKILMYVRNGYEVCLALYGHPGVFVNPSHRAIEIARKEGYKAEMLPGVSTEDCLFADLGVDPASVGCLSYEATDLLLRRRLIDPRCSVIVWQIGVVGNLKFNKGKSKTKEIGVNLLKDYLLQYYPSEHLVMIYEAAQFSVLEPTKISCKIEDITLNKISSISTLYIPPYETSSMDSSMFYDLKIEIN